MPDLLDSRLKRAGVVLFAALLWVAFGGCVDDALAPSGMWSTAGTPAPGAFVTVPAGTWMGVRTSSALSSEAVHAGDAWSGVLISRVRVGHRSVLETGDRVAGVVTCVRGFSAGARALLDLEVVGVRTRQLDVALDAGMDAMTAARGYPVLLRPGTVLFFTVNQPVSLSIER